MFSKVNKITRTFVLQTLVLVVRTNVTREANLLVPLIFKQLEKPAALFSSTSACYAKNKDKKKEKSGKNSPKTEINEHLLRDVLNYDGLTTQMQRAVDHMKLDFIKNLSLRSTTGAIDNLRVTVDGKEYELQELAQISRKNPKTIVINMIAFPQTIPDVLKSIEKSGMNLNPQQDGTTLFVPIPKVTKEHRENLSKNAKSLFIKYRDIIKDVQNSNIKKIKKQPEMSKDDIFSVQNQITAIAENYIKEADKILQTKLRELLGDSQ